VERKAFLKFLAAGAAAGTVANYLSSCSKTDDAPTVDFTIDLSQPANSNLLQPGGSLIKQQVIVINNNGSYLALSDICTHEGCSLAYNNSAKKLNCPCHGATFTLTGDVLSGPANRSLKQYNVTLNGNVLRING
jgi:cytochrome b6-f complex iron-sulfur subunit